VSRSDDCATPSTRHAPTVVGKNLRILAVVVVTLGVYAWVADSIPEVPPAARETLGVSGDSSEMQRPAALVGVTDPVELLQVGRCLGCHTLSGRGVALGPPFDGMGSRFDEAYIRRSILDPGAEASDGFEHLRGAMEPGIGQTLTEAQVEIIVGFLASQR